MELILDYVYLFMAFCAVSLGLVISEHFEGFIRTKRYSEAKSRSDIYAMERRAVRAEKECAALRAQLERVLAELEDLRDRKKR